MGLYDFSLFVAFTKFFLSLKDHSFPNCTRFI